MFDTKIKILLIASLFLSPLLSKAQANAGIGVGAEIGLPSGNFSNLSGIGLGASVKADLPVAENFAISLNAGFMNFFGRRNQLFSVQDLTYIPAKAGLKYQLSESFYAEGQLGAALPLNKDQKTLFAWSPGLGNQFKLSGGNKLDLGIRYEAWTGKNNTIGLNSSDTKGFVGIRFAYVLGL
ncbi:MAG: outer membrane beta-barrel protein [Sphingobacteriaceae bacterium]|nr:outer membrane beta-barrel protein [Sphingobacteriaceae bacterium]